MTHALTDALVAAIIQVLNTMPAGQVRHILNELERQMLTEVVSDATKGAPP